MVARDPSDFDYYKKWLIKRANGVPTLFNSQYNNKIHSFTIVEIGGKIYPDGYELGHREMNLSGRFSTLCQVFACSYMFWLICIFQFIDM